MKIAEIRELPNEEISRELAEKKRALFNLRFQRETEQLDARRSCGSSSGTSPGC